jgi:hypothetical protein
MYTLTILPDVESALMFALVPLHPDIRFVTVLPSGDLKKLTARINRSGGANRVSVIAHSNNWVDLATVEIDVWGFSNNTMEVSIAAREIQASLLGLAGTQVQNGVIQHVATVTGPRRLPEVNTKLARYNASYEVRLHP